MSADRSALDTNVLVYVYSRDPVKTAPARRLVEAGGIVSMQALNEFVHLARRKMGFGWPDVRAAVSAFEAMLDVRDLTLADHWRALRIAEQTHYSIHDALMLAVALEAGARTFWSEDMQDGRVVEGMTIRDPFAAQG